MTYKKACVIFSSVIILGLFLSNIRSHYVSVGESFLMLIYFVALLFNLAFPFPRNLRLPINGIMFTVNTVLLVLEGIDPSEILWWVIVGFEVVFPVFMFIDVGGVYPWMNLGRTESIPKIVFCRILKFLRRFSNAGSMRYVAGGLAVVLITLGSFYLYAAPILLFRGGIWLIVVAALVIAGVSGARIARFDAPTVYRSGRFSHSLLVVELIVGMVASIYWVCRFGRYFP